MTSTPPSAPHPSTAARPRLTRSRTDRRIAGVAGGQAEHPGVGAGIWRVARVALTVAGGCGVLLYALLWLLMPPADQPA